MAIPEFFGHQVLEKQSDPMSWWFSLSYEKQRFCSVIGHADCYPADELCCTRISNAPLGRASVAKAVAPARSGVSPKTPDYHVRP